MMAFSSSAVALVALLCAGHAAGLSTQANPIRKVVTLMQDMQKQIEVEVVEEKELFEKFMCICAEYPSELKDTVDEASKSVEELSGAVTAETAEKARLAEELKGHGEDKAAAEADLRKGTSLREKEAGDCEEEVANLKASISGLGKAIPAIEGGSGAALLQRNVVPTLEAALKSTPDLSGWQKQQVTAFISGSARGGDSSEVVGILKQMLDDMTKSLADAEKGDKIAADGFASLKGAKEEQIKVAAQAISGKEKRSGELAVSIVSNQGALDDAEDRKAEAQKMLNTLETTCGSRKLAWEAHFKTRANEVSAISETIAILNDDDALDVFKKAAPALVQGRATGLLQSRRSAFQALESLRLTVHRSQTSGRASAAKALLAGLLQEPAPTAEHAPTAEPENELEKVPGHMIENLDHEQEDDAKKKEFCEAEIAKAEGAEKAKQDALEELDAAVEQISDEVAVIDEELAAIQKEINEIDQSVAKATELRKQEHGEYVESLTMLDAAVALLAKAKNRLTKFYSPALYKASPIKERTMEEKITGSLGSSFGQRSARKHTTGAFLQLAKKQLPDLPTVPKFEKKNSGGVIALLDKLSQEMVLDKAESGHDENSAQTDYVELMNESTISREEDMKSIVAKTEVKTTLQTRLLEAKASKHQTFAELTNAHELTQTLHGSCDFLLQHFEDREAARVAEIDNLKAAKRVLHER